jgi:hypothetical protein
MGYSRGAYAVRSLAGLIDRMGLLRAVYREAPDSRAARALKAARVPCPCRYRLSRRLRHGAGAGHPLADPVALRARAAPLPFPRAGALDPDRAPRACAERTREAYAPVLWDVSPERAASGAVQQMWFRGAHGDVGGQLGGYAPARALSNIALTWMLGEAEAAGLPLPPLWRVRLVTDAGARPSGTLRGAGRYFLARRPRRVGLDPSECIHPSARAAASARGLNLPEGAPA